MTVIKIEIVSDAICPWVRTRPSPRRTNTDECQCYIGYRNLQRAIRLYQKTYPGGSQDVFDITWKPYFLDQVPRERELIHGTSSIPCTSGRV